MTALKTGPAATVAVVLADLERDLAGTGCASPRVVAEWLLGAVLDCARLNLYTRLDADLNDAQQLVLRGYRARALAGEPVQYIIGETSFMGLPIRCDPRALIPRPETEVLVDCVWQDPLFRDRRSVSVIDVGTGTGCIALALAMKRPDARIWAIDALPTALDLACENAARLGMQDAVSFVQGDLLAGVPAASADLVVANLPYIETATISELSVTVRAYEPVSALDGGPDGLVLIRRLSAQARTVLGRAGRLYLEIGADQGAAVCALLEEQGYMEVTRIPDWAGRDRVVRGTLP